MKLVVVSILMFYPIASALQSSSAGNEKMEFKGDSSFIGTYMVGRPLSFVLLRFLPDGTFENEYFCDICPAYQIRGLYTLNKDTIWMKDTGSYAEQVFSNGQINYSPWYNPLQKDTILVYPMYRWHIVDSMQFIGPVPLTDSISRRVKAILAYPNEYVRMDHLPYHKIK